MNVENFIGQYNNYPILFLGTGFSLRYLKNSYTWDSLLKKIGIELKDEEYFLNLKAKCMILNGRNDEFDYQKLGGLIEEDFNNQLECDRNGKFKEINDMFFKNMKEGHVISRFKIYIAKLLSELEFKTEKGGELEEFKKVKGNICSIITTNYDKLIEEVLNFNPLIGNDILLSNPYGTLYKIHGCVDDPEKLIISKNDYEYFEKRYDLIKAQLISFFIHNPIIFIGYSVSDNNIKNILKTIFSYVKPNSDEAKKISDNFLLVEYKKNSTNEMITNHDIDIDGFPLIKVNKLSTDNFRALYNPLINLDLPVSVMDLKKVRNVIRGIETGNSKIKVSIAEDFESLASHVKVLAMGSREIIKHDYTRLKDLIPNYFRIIKEKDIEILTLIEKETLPNNHYFPIYGFQTLGRKLKKAKIDILIKQQNKKLKDIKTSLASKCKTSHNSIEKILKDEKISASRKVDAVLWGILEKKIDLIGIERYLKERIDKTSTNYKKILCAYDYIKYSKPK